VGAREQAQIGAARGQDGVDVGVRRDVAHRHGGDAHLVADASANGVWNSRP
jgi:hypothetical protein